MSEIAERPNRIPWPPIVCIAGIAAAIWLGVLYPLPWFGAPLGDILFAIGILLVAAVVAIDVSAMMALRRASTTAMPNRAAAHLVTSGPYAVTRNPIYLGYAILLVGTGMIVGNPWFFVFAIAVVVAIDRLAVRPEEKHLEARFGKRYRDYAKKVRRWI